MRRIALALTLAAGCASNHHVSPFPPPEALGPLVGEGDLDRQLARVDAETARAGLARTHETRGALADGAPFVVRGYDGLDALGRAVHATRVATPWGVVLALGPPDARDVSAVPCELVASLADGGWASGTDLNGDGAPDVVVRDARGTLVLWRIDRLGAAPYPHDLAFRATRVLDADEDGHPDLAGAAESGEGALAPQLIDVAVFARGRYEQGGAPARAWHARERDAAAARVAKGVEAHAVADACRAALERAWHAARAGGDAGRALAEADAVASALAPLPEGLAQAWVRARGRVADLAAAR